MTRMDDTPDLSRRRLRARRGLAAGAAYVAPTLLQLTPAHASGFSRGSGYSRPSYSRPSRGASRNRPRYDQRHGPYRDRLTREERAARYLLETLRMR